MLNYQAIRNSVNRKHYDELYPNDRPLTASGTKGETIYIGNNTSNRHTWNDMPWIDYWSTFVDYRSNYVRCAICGKPLYLHWNNLSEDEQKEIKAATNNHEGDMQAEGGHIAKDTIHRRFWIVPMCPACNGQEGNTKVTFDHDVSAVEEKHPNIV